jgi:predicted RecA/RadA family phage recombinase
MKSLIANLRNLVLPFGATSGPRIVLDGVDGEIDVYDANNNLVGQLNSNGLKVAAGNATYIWLHEGNTFCNLEMMPVGLNGAVTYLPGTIMVDDGTGPPDHRPEMLIHSPTSELNINTATIQLNGAGLNTLTSSILLDADSTVVNNGGSGLDLGTWQTYTPAWTALTTNPTIGNAVISGRYMYLNKHTVKAVIRIAPGTTSAKGTGAYRFSLPVAAADNVGFGAVGAWAMNDSGSALRTGSAVLINTTTIELWVNGTGGAFAAANYLGALAGSFIDIEIDYEV